MTHIDVQNLFDRLQAISAQHEAKVRDVQREVADGLLTQAGADDRLAGWEKQQGWANQLDDIRTELAEALSESESSVGKVRDKMMAPSGDTNAQLLAETRLARVWPRVKADLDKAEGKPLLDAAVSALTSSDASVRPVLAQELQPYLAGRKFAPSTIDSHVLRHADLKFGKALDAATEDKKASVLVNYNVGVVDSQLKAGAGRDLSKTTHWVSPGAVEGGASSGDSI